MSIIETHKSSLTDLTEVLHKAGTRKQQRLIIFARSNIGLLQFTFFSPFLDKFITKKSYNVYVLIFRFF